MQKAEQAVSGRTIENGMIAGGHVIVIASDYLLTGLARDLETVGSAEARVRLAFLLGADVGLDAVDGEVRHGETGGGVTLFRLLPPQPHAGGSHCETKWALPTRRFDFVCLPLATALLAVDADVAESDDVGFGCATARRGDLKAEAGGGSVFIGLRFWRHREGSRAAAARWQLLRDLEMG